MTLEVIGFWILAVVLVSSALAVVLTKNLFHSVLWLALALTGTAGIFLMLNAEFLAGVQILLYAGAVSGKPYPMLSNVTITNNTFNPKGWGPIYPSKLDTTSTNQWANNWLLSGTVVTAPTGMA